MYKQTLYYFRFCIICSLIWCILSERVDVHSLAAGAVLGFISVIMTEKVLLSSRYSTLYEISIFKLFKYIIYLVFQIYLSGLSTIPKIITGRINPVIIDIKTDSDNELHICIIANSITLTPGTVTIDKKGKILKVLWIDPLTKNSLKAGEIIKGKYEAMLLR